MCSCQCSSSQGKHTKDDLITSRIIKAVVLIALTFYVIYDIRESVQSRERLNYLSLRVKLLERFLTISDCDNIKQAKVWMLSNWLIKTVAEKFSRHNLKYDWKKWRISAPVVLYCLAVKLMCFCCTVLFNSVVFVCLLVYKVTAPIIKSCYHLWSVITL